MTNQHNDITPPLELTGAATMGGHMTVDVVIDGATVTATIDGVRHSHTVAPVGSHLEKILGHWERDDTRMLVFSFVDVQVGRVVAIYGESTGSTDPDYFWYIDRPERSGWGSLHAFLAAHGVEDAL